MAVTVAAFEELLVCETSVMIWKSNLYLVGLQKLENAGYSFFVAFSSLFIFLSTWEGMLLV
jgi:hypothetical protein